MPGSNSFGQPLVRCAIYTRRSVKTELDGADFNSIEVQRETCSAYIRTQCSRGWIEIAKRYDDLGYSGGNTNRPALREVLADVERGFVDAIIIYKLDRLTRSLGDFVRLADLLDQFDVTFVSVTQCFDARETMGRLILNILLTFAQFEREMIADRARDKMATLRRAGRWTGGSPPYGYDSNNKRLVINEAEAATVRWIYERYAECRNPGVVLQELLERGFRTKIWLTRKGHVSGGRLPSRTMIYWMLGNPVYVGEIHYRGQVYQGAHRPIIERDLWDRVQAIRSSRKLKQPPVRPEANLLLGLLYDDVGRVMRVDTKLRKDCKYRYYRSDPNHRASRQGIRTVRARCDDLEDLVLATICAFFRDRFRLSGAIHSIGVRNSVTDKMIDSGSLAARRLETFDRRKLRFAYEAFFDRIELSRETLRLILRTNQLVAFLAWPGTGVFRLKTADVGLHSISLVEVEACAVRSERNFRLPIQPQPRSGRRPKKALVRLMRLARTYQSAVYENRQKSIDEIAAELGRRTSDVQRILRLNYLAPDIIAQIVDGTQPPTLTPKTLLYRNLPMNWAQQRALLGFPAQRDRCAVEESY